MWQTNVGENLDEKLDENVDDLFLAGQKVRPGTYRQIGSAREVLLETEDVLPASLDGRVACYMRIHNTWAQVCRQTGLHV